MAINVVSCIGAEPELVDERSNVIEEEKEEKFGFINLYPNPASDRLNMELSLPTESTVKIEILNALGKLVATEEKSMIKGTNTSLIDIGHLVSGMYFMTISSEGKYKQIKFIKE